MVVDVCLGVDWGVGSTRRCLFGTQDWYWLLLPCVSEVATVLVPKFEVRTLLLLICLPVQLGALVRETVTPMSGRVRLCAGLIGLVLSCFPSHNDRPKSPGSLHGHTQRQPPLTCFA